MTDQVQFKLLDKTSKPKQNELNEAKEAVLQDIGSTRWDEPKGTWFKYLCPSFRFAQTVRDRVNGQLQRQDGSSSRKAMVIQSEFNSETGGYDVYLYVHVGR